MKRSEPFKAIAAALVAAQAEMPVPKKTAINPHYKNKYAPLESIVAAVHPHLAKFGLGVSQDSVIMDDGTVRVTTLLMHASGEWIEGYVEAVPARKDPQGIGSCLTYGRRYGYSILGVVSEEDDDGHSASDKKDVTPTPTTDKPKDTQPVWRKHAHSRINNAFQVLNKKTAEFYTGEEYEKRKWDDETAHRYGADAYNKTSRKEWTEEEFEQFIKWLKSIHLRLQNAEDVWSKLPWWGDK